MTTVTLRPEVKPSATPEPQGPPAGLGVCSTCKFYDVDAATPGRGWCRLHDPAPFPPGQPYNTLLGRWPMVLDADWCGDWAARSGSGVAAIRARAAARIGSSGNIVSQQGGMSCAKNKIGEYELTFPAVGTPPVVPTAVVIGAEATVAGMHAFTALTETSVRVQTFNTGGNAVDRAFTVVIV